MLLLLHEEDVLLQEDEMYFPKNISEFTGLIQKSNFFVKDIGHSSFKVFSSHENEIIVSAIKKK